MVKSVLEVDVRRASLRRSRRRVYRLRDEFGQEWQSRDVSCVEFINQEFGQELLVGGNVMDDTRCSGVEFSGSEVWWLVSGWEKIEG